jgi:hypothetical protein
MKTMIKLIEAITGLLVALALAMAMAGLFFR